MSKMPALVVPFVVLVAVVMLGGCGRLGAPTGLGTGARASPTRAGPPLEAASSSGPASPPGRALSGGAGAKVRVVDVVDGDTLRVRSGAEQVTVRLLGIDTPELRTPSGPACFAREATVRAERLLVGREVRLEYDDGPGRLDRYGRTLAYVWLAQGPDPMRQVNELLLREGSARTYDRGPPHRYQREFDAAEAAARSGRRGLWAAC